MQVVIALAGRRVDAPQADPPRFPLSSVALVAERLRNKFDQLRVRSLVCSAACGSDLIALGIAAEQSIETYVVLPFDSERFRATSVVDRPVEGEWEDAYDRAIARARAARRLEIVSADVASDEKAYAAASDRIVERACELAGGSAGVVAIAVWEGAPRSESDMTAHFLQYARDAGVRTESILTQP